MAQQRWSEAAAVQKENDLIDGLQMLTHTGNQRGLTRPVKVAFEIEYVVSRRTRIARAAR
ncbi:hypothetical protein ACNKHO_25200 [Shigella flexneri]